MGIPIDGDGDGDGDGDEMMMMGMGMGTGMAMAMAMAMVMAMKLLMNSACVTYQIASPAYMFDMHSSILHTFGKSRSG